MNRNEAAAAGLATYSTGKPCKNGHNAPRYTSCGVCVECLRKSRDDKVRLHNTAHAMRSPDGALFAYKLHPDDHAAALAFCQALDLQRGRLPAAQAVVTVAHVPPPPSGEFDAATAREIARRRAELLGDKAPAAAYLPGEFERNTPPDKR